MNYVTQGLRCLEADYLINQVGSLQCSQSSHSSTGATFVSKLASRQFLGDNRLEVHQESASSANIGNKLQCQKSSSSSAGATASDRVICEQRFREWKSLPHVSYLPRISVSRNEQPDPFKSEELKEAVEEHSGPTLLEQVLEEKKTVSSLPVDQIYGFIKSFAEFRGRVNAYNFKFLNSIAEQISLYWTEGNPGAETISYIQTLGHKIIDWGPGRGYWSYLFTQNGFERVSIDNVAWPTPLVGDIEVTKYGYTRVRELAEEGYILFMSRPQPSRAAEKALQAYEDGDGEYVIVIGAEDEVANEAFWDQLKDPTKWCKQHVPKKAKPYNTDRPGITQKIQVFKAVPGRTAAKVDSENMESILSGIHRVLSYFKKIARRSSMAFDLDVFLKLLQAYPVKELYQLYRAFLALKDTVMAGSELEKGLEDKHSDTDFEKAVSCAVGALTLVKDKDVRAAIEMLLANRQKDLITTLLDIEQHLSDCFEDEFTPLLDFMQGNVK